MDIGTIISNAENAGFIVNAVYPDIIISLKNRAVTTMEVSMALNIPQSMCYRTGKSVMIYMGED